MAEAPTKTLIYRTPDPEAEPNCSECAERRVNLPGALPDIADDFDWLVRDYDSFRLFMMEELAHRFPRRTRWTPADIEVVIVELLASQMDRLSHALDVVHAEHFLATAMRPESVRRLLMLIGYDAVARTPEAAYDRLPPIPLERDDDGAPIEETPDARLERLWTLFPQYMDAARGDGPRRIGEQHRMVTLQDHVDRIAAHPLCERAQARLVWTGAWNTILVSVLLRDAARLDDPLADGPAWASVVQFHQAEGLPLPDIGQDLTRRHVLRIVIDRFRMIGTEVFLEDAQRAPITFWLSVKARPGYFRSEIRDSLMDVYSSDPGGLFEPGNLGFGEDVYASNLIEAAMQVEGIETACLNRFKRMGADTPDRTDEGFIVIDPDEIAICQNTPGAPEMGTFDITVLGGETG